MLPLKYLFCYAENSGLQDILKIEEDEEEEFTSFLRMQIAELSINSKSFIAFCRKTLFKALGLIQKEDLRDDEGKHFRFGTHMFRRSYGVKLTELHLDDWIIAKLLGHKGVNAVIHYRKMSNQILADETHRAREAQTRLLLANLEGWGEDYEQMR